jgi:hypothetical protein
LVPRRAADTPIGRFGQAIVEREVRRGRFVIRTEHGGTKVSWSVTGLRRDAYATRHPFRAVEVKAGAERALPAPRPLREAQLGVPDPAPHGGAAGTRRDAPPEARVGALN